MNTLFPASSIPAAILPCYSQTGDGTTIISESGSCRHYPISIRSTLRQLANIRAVDLTALRQQTTQTTGQRILHVLPLGNDLLLVPVKVRTPQVSRDSCTGYVNACCVKDVRSAAMPPHKAIVIFQSGKEVPILWSAGTVERYLRAARLALDKRAADRQAVTEPDLLAISRKLVEVFQDILALRSRQG